MSQEAVELVINRANTDAAFRQQLLANARAACIGYDLTEAELTTLAALNEERLQASVAELAKRGGKGFI